MKNKSPVVLFRSKGLTMRPWERERESVWKGTHTSKRRTTFRPRQHRIFTCCVYSGVHTRRRKAKYKNYNTTVIVWCCGQIAADLIFFIETRDGGDKSDKLLSTTTKETHAHRDDGGVSFVVNNLSLPCWGQSIPLKTKNTHTQTMYICLPGAGTIIVPKYSSTGRASFVRRKWSTVSEVCTH